LSIFLFLESAHAEVEIEIDPIAYALKGNSLHLIYSGASSRVDLGTFALELPEAEKNENYTVYFKGQGIKWDYFGKSVEGVFWGIQASSTEVNFRFEDPSDSSNTGETNRRVNNYGIRVGYRFGSDGFYITPWISVDKNELLGDDVVLQGEKYDFEETSYFPTVHVGYQF
ncbi:MAG: hypothetical protein GY786_15305, partial [Proteobacteria bacterium]|nr:hypothetical protein [Pseudomonadota bacterium]